MGIVEQDVDQRGFFVVSGVCNTALVKCMARSDHCEVGIDKGANVHGRMEGLAGQSQEGWVMKTVDVMNPGDVEQKSDSNFVENTTGHLGGSETIEVC